MQYNLTDSQSMAIHKYCDCRSSLQEYCIIIKNNLEFINPFISRVSYGDTEVILTFESVDEIQSIQMKPLQQYFHMVLFIFKYFIK